MKTPKDSLTGKLKIGDNWNAITIIALSQNNPLKAIAEFVENSIDARAKNISIIRGKYKGQYFLKIIDDGEGISDFKYVATHIGDSIKRQLKKKGIKGIQGEFGIGLLSFWTVGEELTITSTGRDGKTYRMSLVKNNPGYSINPVPTLFEHRGTTLQIQPILPGIRQLNGEKLQNYLASELRDRISKSGVKITIIDRTARKELLVEPRKFSGRLLHNLPEAKNPIGEIYCELYLTDNSPDNQVGLYKLGTRIIPDITKIEYFNQYPWTSGYLEGIIDVNFLNLTPGTRDGLIYDDQYQSFISSLEHLSYKLSEIIDEQKQAEEEKASVNILHKVKKALKEAFLLLPNEDYNWLDTKGRVKKREKSGTALGKNQTGMGMQETEAVVDGLTEKSDDGETSQQRSFFEFPGPLYRANIIPGSAIIGVQEKKKLRIIARDKTKRQIDSDIEIQWKIIDGEGTIDHSDQEFIEFTAPKEPGLTIIEATVTQDNLSCTADCRITVTEELIPNRDNKKNQSAQSHGLPGYTYHKAPGELWRSRYDLTNYLIIINNAHADFIYASKSKMRKLKYITRLFAKELVLANFPEAKKEELLERVIELILYTEENLR
ncbi:MAG: ATP-binding protein [Spirochaetes bacterium]|nr:ATP-binding protein [Spirochaetota bacterium]